MSRIGKKGIQISPDVNVKVKDREVSVEGPKGKLSFTVSDDVDVFLREGVLSVSPVNNSKEARSKWGMSRTMLSNLLHGVKEGYERKLEISGVGYRASMVERDLKISLGFSHDIFYYPPPEVSLSVPKPTEIIVSGINKQQVGQVASEIRDYRKPEPYKGRGIKYADEVVVRKEGKKK
ncbi:50S ribosomal protein L6 [Candidatus Liberibacter sp.]|uniref:50S ribosomal protein L6 n=1 Tax=Candidatus Liberibacter sp. TaxID=34022 RepID=UPI0015F6F1BE|nr:50S ribosomal protein L6 [Candidatus Liberibacter sp.]MBA5724635.1 50S ribosomal protein L6 [Candidatus Liberibacter sp.]